MRCARCLSLLACCCWGIMPTSCLHARHGISLQMYHCRSAPLIADQQLWFEWEVSPLLFSWFLTWWINSSVVCGVDLAASGSCSISLFNGRSAGAIWVTCTTPPLFHLTFWSHIGLILKIEQRHADAVLVHSMTDQQDPSRLQVSLLLFSCDILGP